MPLLMSVMLAKLPYTALLSSVMYPILGRYGPFFLFSYTVVLGIGVGAGIGLGIWQSRKRHVPVDWLDGLLVGLVMGLIGGRSGFVGNEWAYFSERPFQIFQFQQGGLSYHGALLAGLAGLWGWHVWRKRPLTPTIDLLALSLALVSAFGWFACWLEGCAFGKEVIAINPLIGRLLAGDLPDTFGVFAWRYQTQILGIVLSLIVFILILLRQRHWQPGKAFWFALFFLSLGRMGIGMLRGDMVLQISNVRVDVLLDALIAIFSLLLIKFSHAKNFDSQTDDQ